MTRLFARNSLAGYLGLAGLFMGLVVSSGAPASSGSGGRNAEQHLDKPYLIIISIDGYRSDFLQQYPTRAIKRFAEEGTRSEALVPVWPTLTFPNHYSIVTGMQPANHGLVSNTFYDPGLDRWYAIRDRSAVMDQQFYAGEPIWVTAETQGMVSASYFWVGSEAPIKDVKPTFWKIYDGDVPEHARVSQVLKWLELPEAQRPHLFTLYFEIVDSNAHWLGEGSDEFMQALETVDDALKWLFNGIEKLPFAEQIYVMLVSDHGSSPYSDAEPFILDERVDTQGWQWINGGSYLHGWQHQRNSDEADKLARTINSQWEHGKAYSRRTAPAELGMQENDRYPDLVLIPELGFAALSSAEKRNRIIAGDHGWHPQNPAMHGIFMLRGKGIEAGRVLPPVNVVDIYPLMTRILGLQPADALDSNLDALGDVLEIE